MTALLQKLWQIIWGKAEPEADPVPAQPPPPAKAASFELLRGDPLFDFLQRTSGPVELDRLNFDSPALQQLQAAGVKLVAPLVNQGELIGLLKLDNDISEDQNWRTLAEFSLASTTGNEREAMRQVGQAVQILSLPDSLLDRLKTAVAEATMNAIEHGNKNQPDLPVVIQVQVSSAAVRVRITDQGGGQPIPEPEAPNLEAKLAGLQTPRGWGLFLIKNLTDEMRVISDDTHHTIELIISLEAEKNANQTS